MSFLTINIYQIQRGILMKNINLLNSVITLSEIALNSFRAQDTFNGYTYLRYISSTLSAVSPDIILKINIQLEALLNAQATNDYIYIADVLEAVFIPTVKDTLVFLVQENADNMCTNFLSDNLQLLQDEDLKQKILANIDSALDDNTYNLELTNNGKYTFFINKNNKAFYFHSNVNPDNEGAHFAKFYCEANHYDYTVLGFGFGYHIRGMLNNDRRNRIRVIETNLNTLTLAFIWCDLRDILESNRIELKLCEEKKLVDYITGQLVLHYPSVNALDSLEIKAKLQDYFTTTNSMISHKNEIDCNFYYNIKRGDKPVNTILNIFKSKPVIYVAGGPSLEYNIDFLKHCYTQKSHIILCASTSYRKLLNHGIIPDFVMIIDPKQRLLWHIKNTGDTGASLIYLSTASEAAINEFAGKRYIAFQKGYEDAVNFAHKHDLEMFDTGGSVSTTAMDMLIKAGCTDITTIGLDLANTDGKRHAFDNPGSEKSAHTLLVKSVAGGMVTTTQILNSYRLWIEKRIKNCTDIKFTNMSHGAVIEGMKNIL